MKTRIEGLIIKTKKLYLKCPVCNNQFSVRATNEGKIWNGENKYCCRKCFIIQNNRNRKKKIEYTVDENGCHICTSHAMHGAYYGIKRDGKLYQLHRWIWIQANGEISESLFVRHKCDNPKCINIEHLETGTHKDNMKDMVIRGRSQRGEKHYRSKLTEKDVIFIRGCKDKTRKELAKLFNVEYNTIRKILTNQTWRHVNV